MTDQIPEVWVTHNFDRKHRKGEPCGMCEWIDGRARQSTMPSVTTCDKCGLTYYQTSAPHICAEWTKGRTEHEPVARGGEGERWEYMETAGTGEIRIGEITLRPHWTGLADGGEMRRLLKQGADAVNQHHSLLAEQERLREALKGVAIMLNTELEKYDKEPWAQRVRAALNDQKGVASADQKGGEG